MENNSFEFCYDKVMPNERHGVSNHRQLCLFLNFFSASNKWSQTIDLLCGNTTRTIGSPSQKPQRCGKRFHVSDVGLILGMGSANERRHYNVTPSLIGWPILRMIPVGMGSTNERRRYFVTPSLISWAHTHNDPCDVSSIAVQGYVS